MSFSELKMLTADTGLSFSDETLTLSGKLNGIDVTVSDTGNSYIAAFFVRIPLELDKTVVDKVNELALSMPLNAIISQKSEVKYLKIELLSSVLFQENAIYLTDFLNALTAYLAAQELEKTEPEVKAVIPPLEAKVKSKLKKGTFSQHFDKHSVIGIIAAFIGMLACAIFQGYIVRLTSDTTLIEVKTAVIGGLAALVILLDYKFAARKFDIAGIISTSVFIAGFIALSAFFCNVTTIKALMFDVLGENRSFLDVAGNSFEYLEQLGAEYDTIPYAVKMLVMNIVAAVLACTGFYAWYFRKNSVQMYESEDGEK